jgi:hypothetical protein
MAFDRNPKFGADLSFTEGARRVADMLWENTGGDVTQFPKSYLETLRHDYADGKVSMLELMDRVDLGPGATYEEYCEVVDSLLGVNPNSWPAPESVLAVDKGALLYEVEQDFSEFEEFDEFNFAEDDMSGKMETFLKKVISSVYLDGVNSVTDDNGDPPNENNNYLLSDDGKEFSGVFYGSTVKGKEAFPFTITDNNGKWSIEY